MGEDRKTFKIKDGHLGEVKIADLKAEMKRNGIPVREVFYGQDR